MTAVLKTMGGDWNNSDRFLVMLVLAGILHAMLILGVGFDLPEPERIRKSLEIVLVRNPSRQAPDKADYLAQENQFGSGSAEEKAIPKTELTPQQGEGQQIQSVPNPARVPEVKHKPLLKQAKSEKKVVQDVGTEEHSEEERPRINADALTQQIAEISAEYNKKREEDAARGPKFVYVNAVNAHRYHAANYLHEMESKILNIGNLHYPDEARRHNLTGRAHLRIAVKSDGSLYSVIILHSSGEVVLDDAAVRFVKQSAPFGAFPEEVRHEADVLVNERIFFFDNGMALESGH
ncbi:MAG TPA: TonB family protein [Methylococcaceae bacterium]|nr:TonB family protein [Methylococcaceae bacterium]